MKILFLLTQDLESPAGVGRYFPWARALAQRGHTVSMAALHASFDTLTETDFVHEGVEVHYVAQMHVRKQGSRKLYYPAHQLIGVAARATQALTQAALRLPAEVIQLGKPHPMNSVAGLWARRRRGIPLFVDCDDFEMVNLHFSGGGWQQRGVRFFENFTPRRADHISAHTYFLRDHLLGLGIPEERFTYLPHGADLARFAHVDLAQVERLRTNLGVEGKEVVAFIGSLSLPSHPVELLLEAFQRVHTLRPHAVLLIVGGGEEYDRLVLRVQEMGLGAAVIFRGRVPGAQVPLFCRMANVQAEPVIDNLVGRSSLPLKMFESWASGVPFVTGDVGDRQRVMGDPPAGVVARPGDAESLAEAILQVLSNPRLASTLRARGLERAQEYAWERLVERMETAYHQAVERRRDRHA